MSKKKDKPVFSSVTEELMYLRKQNTGLKGQIGLLMSQKKDLNKYIDKLKDELVRNEKIVSGLESQVSEISRELACSRQMVVGLKNKLAPLEANIEYYNELPWYKRIFVKKLL